ncbi:MAG: hypothetical protein OJF52_002788 [Nitrospira sp.]|nr:MAG: hypothetical protein OJF52_002788 [Nitrospira sp.]
MTLPFLGRYNSQQFIHFPRALPCKSSGRLCNDWVKIFGDRASREGVPG